MLLLEHLEVGFTQPDCFYLPTSPSLVTLASRQELGSLDKSSISFQSDIVLYMYFPQIYEWPEAFRGSHRVRLEVGLEDLPLGVVDALGLLEEARHEVREEDLEFDGRHVEHARRDLLPQLDGQVVCNNVALVRASK